MAAAGGRPKFLPMARYEHLPVFKAVYDFNLYFHRLAQGFPKDVKYGLAGEVRALLSNLLDQIVLANNSRDKAVCLAQAEHCIELAKIKSRMLQDLGALSVKSYAHIAKTLVGISQQISAWEAWAKKNLSN
ncbi:four helix bundle protein [Patescibacteria group bacterium]|nr:four helix bundle protein [Patescibacteria group bacterium]